MRTTAPRARPWADVSGAFSQEVLLLATGAPSRLEFLRAATKLVVGLTGVDRVELTIFEEEPALRCTAARAPRMRCRVETLEPGWMPRKGHARAPVRSAGKEVGSLDLWDRAGCEVGRGVCEGIARSIGLAIALRSAEANLRERVKELGCLYGIAQIVGAGEGSLADVLGAVARLLPSAWKHASVAEARITIDGSEHATAGFRTGVQRQKADVYVGSTCHGTVEVCYTRRRPRAHEGPFLKEERNLIDAVAREVAIIVERWQAREENAQLQEQLRHADRLATIGQLAAGVAHELNEPLNNVLGFAQLALASPGLPEEASSDLDKIVAAALHAREVIRKLMIFARQMPPQKTEVDLNRVVEEGLYFLEARCAKAGIRVERSLAASLPLVTADPSQLTQVLVNLVVNAVQAMPDGGVLTIRTEAEPGLAILVVQDTGVGMTAGVKRKAFLPFFTTKDIGEGTGLGLAVVHGIVAAHNGTVGVDSAPGRGTRFAIRLPVSQPAELGTDESSDEHGVTTAEVQDPRGRRRDGHAGGRSQEPHP